MSRAQIKFIALALLVLALTMLPYLITLAGWASGGGD